MSVLKKKIGLLKRKMDSTTFDDTDVVAEGIRRTAGDVGLLSRSMAEKKSKVCLSQLLDAKKLHKGCLLKEITIAIDSHHGIAPLLQDVELLQGVEVFGHSAGARQLLFMDTETTGLSGGAGTLVFLLGLARLDCESKTLELRQYFLSSFAGEKTLLEHAAQWISEDDVLVTYNGKSFDVPLLASRYRMSGVSDPFSGLEHLDLLHLTRRVYQKQWDNCRLGTAEKKLLGFHRLNDLPGSEAPMVWMEWIRSGFHRRIKPVMQHNYYDLLSLLGLLTPLLDVYHARKLEHVDILGLAKFFSKNNRAEMAYQLLKENQARLSDRGLLELAGYHRASNNWSQAIAIWSLLSRRGCLISIENLAKYHEHRSRDYNMALTMTQKLLEKLNNCEAYVKRKERLLKKIGDSNMELNVA